MKKSARRDELKSTHVRMNGTAVRRQMARISSKSATTTCTSLVETLEVSRVLPLSEDVSS